MVWKERDNLYYKTSSADLPPNQRFSLCMCVSASKVNALRVDGQKGVHLLDGYLRLPLSGSAPYKNIVAHKFVLWACHGFPPDFLSPLSSSEGGGEAGSSSLSPPPMPQAPPQLKAPPKFMYEPLALHICGNKACMNPSHLVWGYASHNSAPDWDPDVYFPLLSAQRGKVVNASDDECAHIEWRFRWVEGCKGKHLYKPPD